MVTMDDLNRLALRLPRSVMEMRDGGHPNYLVEGKIYCRHREPRKDAVDDVTGALLDDVLIFRITDIEMKNMWLADPRGIFFTSSHFDGHLWVLLRIRDLQEAEENELGAVV